MKTSTAPVGSETPAGIIAQDEQTIQDEHSQELEESSNESFKAYS